MTSLELSFEQLKAFFLTMPTKKVRQQIWTSWKAEKHAIEVMRNDSTATKNTAHSVNFVFVHNNGIKRVATDRRALAENVRVS